MSVPSCDEAAPQSHEVFTHCALNPATMKKSSMPVLDEDVQLKMGCNSAIVPQENYEALV